MSPSDHWHYQDQPFHGLPYYKSKDAGGHSKNEVPRLLNEIKHITESIILRIDSLHHRDRVCFVLHTGTTVFLCFSVLGVTPRTEKRIQKLWKYQRIQKLVGCIVGSDGIVNSSWQGTSHTGRTNGINQAPVTKGARATANSLAYPRALHSLQLQVKYFRGHKQNTPKLNTLHFDLPVHRTAYRGGIEGSSSSSIINRSAKKGSSRQSPADSQDARRFLKERSSRSMLLPGAYQECSEGLEFRNSDAGRFLGSQVMSVGIEKAEGNDEPTHKWFQLLQHHIHKVD